MRLVLGDKRLLVATVTLLLLVGFLATSLASYFVSRQSLRDAVIETELPLTSDNIYSEIQKDLIQPIIISSVMATDTFLRDWVLDGEEDVERITQYLHAIKERYSAVTSFFVSDRTSIYYHADGILKRVDAKEPRDEWYYRVRDMLLPYEINVDPDLANQDTMTIFINYRVMDYSGNFIGAAGIGLTVNAVRTLIDDYQSRFGRTVYFADSHGRIVLVGADNSVPENEIGQRGLWVICIRSGRRGRHAPSSMIIAAARGSSMYVSFLNSAGICLLRRRRIATSHRYGARFISTC